MAVRGPDTRIPLMAEAPQHLDVLGTMGRIAQMKRLEAISQQEQQEMALKQQAAQEDAQVKQLFAEPGMTWEKAIPVLQRINPQRALAVQKLVDEQRGAAQTAHGKQIDIDAKTKAQQEDTAFEAVMTETGGDLSIAMPKLMAINPKRALEFQKLSREAQTKLEKVEYSEDGKVKVGFADPYAGTVTPTGLTAAGSIDDERAAAQAAEQQRHNRTTEGLAGAQLGLAREKFKLDQKTSTASAENLDAVGTMVLDNPDILKDFPAKDRGRILTHIANAGGNFPNKRKEKVASMAKSALDTITQMENHGGLAGAVGAKGPTSAFGWLDTPMAGTKAADFTRLSEALKSQITLPNLELMKGLGAMSDREFKTMADAATALDRSMSEGAYKAELKRLKDTLSGLANRAPEAPPIAGGDNPFRKK